MYIPALIMPKYSNNDHYLDAATGVLKNRLGITSQITLEKIEADLASIRSYELAINPLHGSFDLAHLQALHYYLFQDVYEWAGQLRDIDISKGSSFFAHHTHIVTAAKPIFTKLAADKNLTGLSKELFSNKAAHYLAEIMRRTLSAKATGAYNVNSSAISPITTAFLSNGKISTRRNCFRRLSSPLRQEIAQNSRSISTPISRRSIWKQNATFPEKTRTNNHSNLKSNRMTT